MITKIAETFNAELSTPSKCINIPSVKFFRLGSMTFPRLPLASLPGSVLYRQA